MRAWLESGRRNVFRGVSDSDVILRTTTNSNMLILGNGFDPLLPAAFYLSSNCVGLNRLPSTQPHMSLDIDGVTACRSNMIWIDRRATCKEILSGSNAIRISPSSLVVNDGTRDCIVLNRSGSINTVGTLHAPCAVLGLDLESLESLRATHTDLSVLSVGGRGDFRDGVRLCIDKSANVLDSCLSYSSSAQTLSVGSRLVINDKGLKVVGGVTASGKVLAQAFNVLSDSRLKQEIVSSVREDDLSKIMALDVKRYRFISDAAIDSHPPRPHIGVLAQELAKIIPEAVSSCVDYLPNIMSDAVIRRKGDTHIYVLSFTKDVSLIQDDRIRLKLCDDDTMTEAQIIEIHKTESLVSGSYGIVFKEREITRAPDQAVFVYGSLCSDVLSVDTSQIVFRLVSAVQELQHQLVVLRNNISGS